MAKSNVYTLGPDLPESELRESKGRIVDDAYIDSAVEEAVATVRGRGRPSLSETGESPLLRVRLPRDLDDAVRRAAAAAGTSRSEWVRLALDDAVHRTG